MLRYTLSKTNRRLLPLIRILRRIFFPVRVRGEVHRIEMRCIAEHKIIIDKSLGFTTSTPEPILNEKWIVIILERELRRLGKAGKIGLFAHEFAHVFLRHETGLTSNNTQKDEKERGIR